MKLGIVMDPIESINYKKDSSLDIMIEACHRNLPNKSLPES